MKSEIKRRTARTSKERIMAMGLAVVAITGATFLTVLSPAKAEKAASAKTVDLGWPTDLEKVLTQAKAQKKYVLADMYTDWCLWCKRLESDTFADPRMTSYLSKKFLCVRLNAEKSKNGRDAAERYKVFGFPCVLVFDTKGHFIGKIPKYYGPEEYQEVLEDLIKNPPSDPYAE